MQSSAMREVRLRPLGDGLWVLIFLSLCFHIQAGTRVEMWLTNPDGTALFQKQDLELSFGAETSGLLSIEVQSTNSHQTIDGFGFTLTGGSAQHLSQMSPANRAALLSELFAADGTNIGISYLRISIGASDLNAQPFSYDDMPAGKTDPQLLHFSLAPDQHELIPILREILALNPYLKILGSPWSAPTWMKTTNDFRGASLQKQYYPVYAQYFVKYLQSMKKEGVPIDAITIQNEPLHPGNNPSMYMEAADQADFIKNHLGPALQAAQLKTKIIIYDHNCDRPDYPISILNDPAAKAYVDGSAFHLYRGKIEALSEVHRAHPDRHLYFTEQWIGGPGNLEGDLSWGVENLIIGATRNWSRNVLEWNLTSAPNYQPHTDRGGCDRCLGGVTIDGNKVTRNPGYYLIAHASKFVRPGSVRIASDLLPSLPNVGFRTPEGKTVLIVLNASRSPHDFQIRWQNQAIRTSLNSRAVATYVW